MFSKKNLKDIPLEETPHGTGSRKLITAKTDTTSLYFEAMTYGYLPKGEKYAMHKHDNIIEICLVVKGTGKVHDSNGNSEDFEPGDRFIFTSDTEHELENTSEETDEFYFFRCQNK